jgi:hypothetical protein
MTSSRTHHSHGYPKRKVATHTLISPVFTTYNNKEDKKEDKENKWKPAFRF